MKLRLLFLLSLLILGPSQLLLRADDSNANLNRFQLKDVFELEFASDPRISPDGGQIVYARRSMDIMTDKVRSRLWLVDSEGGNHRPLTSWDQDAGGPRWSPDGKMLAYAAETENGSEIFVRWMDNGQTSRLTNVEQSPGDLSWSPDGRRLAFSMLVPAKKKPFVSMPDKPKGAKWAGNPKVIDRLVYRSDGRGYLKEGFSQLFVLPVDGGTPRQVTTGSFNHGERPVWSKDGKKLYFSANRHDDWEHNPLNSELYSVDIQSGEIEALTTRVGPDASPSISPDGKSIAFVGFDDESLSYHQSDLYVMDANGKQVRNLTAKFDRAVSNPQFSADGKGVYFQYDDAGNTWVGYASLETEAVEGLLRDVGGTTLGRPYASGSFSVSQNGQIAFARTNPSRPADVAIGSRETRSAQTLTSLNEDLFAHKELGKVESFYFPSSHDNRKIHGWIVKPPGFDPQAKYPLLLEIHGGPFANYGDRFAAEVQLYAAAGYVVVYINPRGSTSYGHGFAKLIDHNYPSEDYDDLMSGVDAVIKKGYIDPDRLYVTGGSGGGVLSSWIVGKTDRFQAAVVAKPVINWYSFVLTSDHYNFFARYWFGKFPWEDPEGYLKRSPISLVGNVKTPTMLLTGEVDYRTPMSETEQFYQALKLRGVDTMLVRVPDASHGIASRPSHMIAKVAHVLKWFEMHPAKK